MDMGIANIYNFEKVVYHGCFRDAFQPQRRLPYMVKYASKEHLSPTKCVRMCNDNGYQYAGMYELDV
jgi:hypothetical protein